MGTGDWRQADRLWHQLWAILAANIPLGTGVRVPPGPRQPALPRSGASGGWLVQLTARNLRRYPWPTGLSRRAGSVLLAQGASVGFCRSVYLVLRELVQHRPLYCTRFSL